MGKTAFIFPGQGSQYVGMGRDFYEKSEICRQVIDAASKESGYDLKHLMFEENDELDITKYTQIAMLADEAAILCKLEEDGIRPDVAAGLSLGEYAALIASGAMEKEDAFRLITVRGRLMQEAVPTGGAMTAVLGLEAEKIEEICEQTEGIVSIANYNCPGQIVITGESAAVNAASEQLKAAGAKRCMPLKVSGPFHSELLEEAGKKLAAEMEQTEVKDARIPYVANVTAQYVTEAKEVKALLEKQISSPVRWQQSVEAMIADGVDVFVEIGPKKSLTKFIQKINPKVTAYHIDTWSDYKEVVSKLQES
ncbi:MAG: ACP S-malonyltransferase [Eubacterium sp.]|nr:ACP S-malonyltransferase [Eubacterium sp.]